MPHDMNGKVLKVGYVVNISCRITAIQLGEDYCNVNLESLKTMSPENKYTNSFSLNTKQVELREVKENQKDYYENKHVR